MKKEPAVAAKWSGLIAIAALGSALAGCGGGGGGGGGGYGGGADPAPTTSLTVNPTNIVLGQSTTLSWSSSQGTSCQASGGWGGQEPATGTADVTPTSAGTISYTLMCSGGGYSGSSNSSVTVTVEPPSVYATTSLVEDFAGGAALTTDPLLVNPWGIAFGPITGAWVANNHGETATIYNGNGRPSPLFVHFGPDTGEPSFEATGIVYNGTSDFLVSTEDQTASAIFVFAGEGGMIAGWSPTVDSSHTLTTDAALDGAVYKGLALANNGNGNFLYATDFANGKIDVYDGTFAKQMRTATSFSFDDPTLPAGFSPFGIQAIKNGAGTTELYVSYAKQDEAQPDDEAPGAGLGIINVFDANGHLLKHLVSEGGKLNAPWGMALAPADFGTFSNALLVGNFGDGTIHGYDPASGRYLGALTDSGGAPLAVPGLWGIGFGNDAANQPHAALFFAAGTNDEANGLYGRIDLGATPPALGEPPAVTLIAPQGDLSGTVTLTANAQNLVTITKVRFFANGSTLIGTATSEPFTVQWNTTAVSNGSATLRAVATDANGNVGSSGILTVAIANAAVTLTQIQQTVLTPRCSGCHDGSQPVNGSLPGAMDLRSGHSFASLANVASLEQPTLMRVKPGDPESSYLIHKLEGSPGISGARMPLGGPFLDEATLDDIKSWIAGGARND
jgi:uncharacterized protein (TIGR03118 family)